MRHIIITDSNALAAALAGVAGEKDDVTVFVHGNRPIAGFKRVLPRGRCAVHRFAALKTMRSRGTERVVICVARGAADTLKKARTVLPAAPILVVEAAAMPKAERERLAAMPDVAIIGGADLFRPAVLQRWKLLELRKRVALMRRCVDPGRPLWILTQNDPDPDAIGSALALTHLLGRSRRNTPIVTFKGVSRNENVSMISLLGIKVKTVTSAALQRAPQVALVDVQPAYFKRPAGNVRIVIDHHPQAELYDVPYVDIQPGYGATSSMMTEYLDAAGLKVNARLATALYYAVKTDTLLFGRGVSPEDFRAFGALWPLADHRMISLMERPCLKTQEVDVFIRALKHHHIERGALFVSLGRVHKEDLVPRLADFVLQIGDAEFALVWGNFGRVTTFSARALNPRIDAGETMRRAFGHLGSAGGHGEMARATMPGKALAADFGVRGEARLAALIKKRVLRIVAAQKRATREK